MDKNLLIEQVEVDNHRISIYNDIWARCPIKEWDMGAKFLIEYLDNRQYHVIDDCDWKEWCPDDNPYRHSMRELIMRMAAEVVPQADIIKAYKTGEIDDIRLIYNRHTHFWELQIWPEWRGKDAKWVVEREFEPYELKTSDWRYELLEPLEEDEVALINLINKYAKDFVVKEWSSCGYSQGDHLRGLAYLSKEDFDKRCGFSPKHYKTWQEQALAIMDAEIKEINMWAWGNVKAYVLEKKVSFTKVYDDEGREDERAVEWEEVISCGGFYKETEDLIKEVMSEHDLKEVA